MIVDIDYKFRSFRKRDTDTVRSFLTKQDLGYPQYSRWIDERAIGGLLAETKHALLVYSNGELVGDLLFQEHQHLDKIVEIKNMRIHPRLRWRAFGRFMIKQLEVEATQAGYLALIGDVREESRDII